MKSKLQYRIFKTEYFLNSHKKSCYGNLKGDHHEKFFRSPNSLELHKKVECREGTLLQKLVKTAKKTEVINVSFSNLKPNSAPTNTELNTSFDTGTTPKKTLLGVVNVSTSSVNNWFVLVNLAISLSLASRIERYCLSNA